MNDPRQINADLHCHSQVSDGVLTPTEVARRAAEHGVRIWALTDHDEVRGLSEAGDAARAAGMQFVPGVEISVTWADETIHIVGLGFDPTNQNLVDGLERTRGGREARAVEMGEKLAAIGIPGAYEGALKHVGNPDLISRTHFARFLVEQGHCRDVGEVFARYLSEGRPGYVAHHWARLGDAVGWIRGAGGVAVVAHPGRYRLDRPALSAFLDEFRDHGGEGLEVISGSHTADQCARFALEALRYGFVASRGSDFHGPGVSKAELGDVPPVPPTLEPVWARWL